MKHEVMKAIVFSNLALLIYSKKKILRFTRFDRFKNLRKDIRRNLKSNIFTLKVFFFPRKLNQGLHERPIFKPHLSRGPSDYLYYICELGPQKAQLSPQHFTSVLNPGGRHIKHPHTNCDINL